jgi:hypothetical protein
MMHHEPDLCPLCRQPNDCAVAAGRMHCWCFDVEIDETSRNRAREVASEGVCICRACGVRPAPAQRLADALELLKRRS